MNSKKEKHVDSNNRPFVRWQATTIAHFGHANNLILGLSTASSGFVVLALLEDLFREGWPVILAIVGAIAFLLSIVAGIACTFTRLLDFRKTTTITRRREKAAPDVELRRIRMQAEIMGAWSWGLLWIELGTFGLGAFAVFASVAATIV